MVIHRDSILITIATTGVSNLGNQYQTGRHTLVTVAMVTMVTHRLCVVMATGSESWGKVSVKSGMELWNACNF